jgi:LacI family transcriptional regulator
MESRPSIRDIAARLGISHTTVSLVLRNSPRITAATKRDVRRVARELGYHPDATVSTLMAKLRTIRTTAVRESLGFITAWPRRDGWRDVPNHVRFFDGAKRRALEVGYSLTELWLKEPGMTDRRMTRILRHRGIRGLILLSLPKTGGRLELEWKHFACVTKGLTVEYPPVHRVLSSHYEDMHLMLTELQRRQYRRIGLVLGEALSARVDRAWLASFLVHQNGRGVGPWVPPLITPEEAGEETFVQWFKSHRPDAILFSERPIPKWVARLNLRVPEDVALAHLDWSKHVSPMAGIDSESEIVGEAAIDLLVGQLQANEFGIPKHEKIVTVRGRWVPGSSVRKA